MWRCYLLRNESGLSFDLVILCRNSGMFHLFYFKSLKVKCYPGFPPLDSAVVGSLTSAALVEWECSWQGRIIGTVWDNCLFSWLWSVFFQFCLIVDWNLKTFDPCIVDVIASIDSPNTCSAGHVHFYHYFTNQVLVSTYIFKHQFKLCNCQFCVKKTHILSHLLCFI